jgi:hypothetical protein
MNMANSVATLLYCLALSLFLYLSIYRSVVIVRQLIEFARRRRRSRHSNVAPQPVSRATAPSRTSWASSIGIAFGCRMRPAHCEPVTYKSRLMVADNDKIKRRSIRPVRMQQEADGSSDKPEAAAAAPPAPPPTPTITTTTTSNQLAWIMHEPLGRRQCNRELVQDCAAASN